MAKIYPERLPENILQDPKRSAERKVFSALKVLPHPYVVFYNVHWQIIAERRGMEEGEADFVIAHPDKGVVVLEVKGGSIRFSTEDSQWYSQDRFGDVHPIKDPVAQGAHNFHELLKQLKSLPDWGNRYLNIANAVCFPDIFVPQDQVLRPDLNRKMILDHDDLDDICTSVDWLFSNLFGEWISRGAPEKDGMRMIENYLARSFEIQTPLGVELEAEDERLIQLTEEQFRALSLLGNRKRAAISGCAGSGKTLLAVRKAQQFADLGMNVLLTCFNAPLAEDLQKRLHNVEVYHFHGLCKAAADQVGYSLRSTSGEDYYEEVLPQVLLEAAEEIGRVYDAIIIDEGQDFQVNYWIALESLLKEEGYLYIFFDSNQNLYSGAGDFAGLIQEPPFSLTRNCRNTQSIHQVVAQFHDNPTSLFADGPVGRPPELIVYQDERDMLRQLQKLLNRLVNVEYIDCRDVVILTPRGGERTQLKPGMKIGNFILSNRHDPRSNAIQVASVYRFKGLERRLVILAEIDAKNHFNSDMVMYVGCSRARTHLVILQDIEAPEELITRLSTFIQ
jgi:hypothetical protein